jgi:osmotically-inducible protein OsmY
MRDADPFPEEAIMTAQTHRAESDTEIAAAAHRALATRRCVPCDRIRIEVRDGRITLEGEVEWLYQCFDAYDAVCHVREAAGCINHITVVAHP